MKIKDKTNNIIFLIIFLLIFINEFEFIDCEGVLITSVSFLFETFSPYAIIRFFEFSDKSWNISDSCLKDMFIYLEGLKQGSIWAVKLYDATSFYAGGTFAGNKYRIHSPELCRLLQFEYQSSIRMHWNIRSNATTIPFPVQIVAAKYDIELGSKLYEYQSVQQLICFPKSCNSMDLENILSVSVFQGNHIVKNMTLTGVRTVSGNYNFYDDGSFYLLMSLLTIVTIIYVFAHFFDYWPGILKAIFKHGIRVEKKSKEVESVGSSIPNNQLESAIEQLSKTSSKDENSMKKFNMHPLADSMTINNINTNNHVNLVKIKKVKSKNVATISLDIIAGNCEYAKTTKKLNFEKDSLIKNLVKAFSLMGNYENLVQKKNEDEEISAVRGLQVICSFSMILLNTYTIMNYFSNNGIMKYNSFLLEFLDIFKNQASYLFDAFFFLGGTNMAHLYFQRISQSSSWNFVDQMLHFLGIIAHKICSLILSYSIILILLELSAKHFHFNSTLEIPSLDYETCELNKWRNVLYIDTFFPMEDRCMAWSWFISMEVQFFIAACVILLLAQIHPRYAGAICTMLFLTSITASTVLEMEPLYFSFNEDTFEKELSDFNLVFGKVLLRISPYLMGMCLGYILHKTKGNFDMNIFVIVFGWIACLLIFIGFTIGFQQMVQLRINPWIRAGVITFSHTIWSVILCWIILASISQYGGLLRMILTSKTFLILGKLSNSTFLLSPLIIRTVLLNSESGIFMSGGQFVIMFLGFSVTTYSVSFILHLFFEAPLLEILRIIYNKNITF